MTMVPYDPTITRALRWMQNKAPRITSLMNQKQAWYDRYNTQFWSNWEDQIFNLKTANPFGLVIWCIILGLPLDIFNFEPLTNAWAYGPQRGNYMDGAHSAPFDFIDGPVVFVNSTETAATVDAENGVVSFSSAPELDSALSWSGTVMNEAGNEINVIKRRFGTGDGVKTSFNLTPEDADNFNTVGYNFQGGGDESVSLLSDVRYACQLRYIALVSNGRQQWINEMLMDIFNGGEAWDLTSGAYFYLTDATEEGSAMEPMTMEYHIGPALPVSAQFLNILNNPEYGIVPQCAGVSYTVIQD